MAEARRRTTPEVIFVACGIWLMALGVYFALVRPPLLPEDLRFIDRGMGHGKLPLASLEPWLHHVFRVMGGFIAASGILTTFLAVSAVATRRRGTGVVLAVTGLATVVTMSWTNFALESQFKWALLVPAVVWCAGIAAYAVEQPRTRRDTPPSSVD